MAEWQLTASDAFVDLTTSVRVRAPGFYGHVEVHLPEDRGTRSADLGTDTLEEALAGAGWRETATLQLKPEEVREQPPGEGVRAPGDVAGLELQVDVPTDDVGVVILEQDESGVLRWHFPLDEQNQVDATRSGPTRTFRIPQAMPRPSGKEGEATRSLLGAAGKVLKVLAYPLADLAGKTLGREVVERWEERNRPYRVRTMTHENYNLAEAPLVSPGDWPRLAQGRALLFIHGTFSRTHSGFGALDEGVVKELCDRYEGRVFAFDHYTLSHSPEENVRTFLQAIPDGVKLDLDIVCHSRGGLVARTLAESGIPGDKVQVRRIVMAAVPNEGTDLADAKHMVAMLDRYTTLLNLSQIPYVGEWLDALLLLVKLTGHGLIAGLPGLAAMHPGEVQVNRYHDATPREYYAIAANFDPRPLRIEHLVQRDRIKDLAVQSAITGADYVIDDLFGQKPNDLVVPTEGVYGKAIAMPPHFPVPEGHVFQFKPADGVMHTTIFGKAATGELLKGWLQRVP